MSSEYIYGTYMLSFYSLQVFIDFFRFSVEQNRDKLQRQVVALDSQLALNAGRIREEQAGR